MESWREISGVTKVFYIILLNDDYQNIYHSLSWLTQTPNIYIPYLGELFLDKMFKMRNEKLSGEEYLVSERLSYHAGSTVSAGFPEEHTREGGRGCSVRLLKP